MELGRRRGLTGVLIATGMLAAGSGSARAADPVPFASVSGECGTSVTLPAQPVSHPSTVVRVVRSGGGDITWTSGPSVVAGQPANLGFLCSDSAVTFTGEVADRPTPPTTYRGRLSAKAMSDAPFAVPAGAVFVGDVTLDQGSLTVAVTRGCFWGWDADTTFASSGQAQLGSLPTGSSNVCVISRPGPPTTFALTIRPLPATPANVTWSKATTVPGVALDAKYALSGDASVTATVRNQAGQVVRTLASAFAVTAGDQSLTWDGRDSGGNPVPDGPYTLAINASSPYGTVAGATSGPLVVDGTAPSVTLTSPATIAPAQALTFAVADSGSGYNSGSAQIDSSGDGFDPVINAGTLVIRPGSGSSSERWALGRHSFAVTADDNLGNTRTIRGSFTVQNPPSSSSAGTSLVTARARGGTMTLTNARNFVRRIVRRHGYAAVADSSGNLRIACTRSSRLRFRCRTSGWIGDSSFRGSGDVWFSTRPTDNTFHYRLRVRTYNDYCYSIHRRNRAKLCSKLRTWRHG